MTDLHRTGRAQCAPLTAAIAGQVSGLLVVVVVDSAVEHFRFIWGAPLGGHQRVWGSFQGGGFDVLIQKVGEKTILCRIHQFVAMYKVVIVNSNVVNA